MATDGNQLALFDYDALDADTRAFVEQGEDEIRRDLKTAASAISRSGRWLIAIKERLGHGRFGPWLKARFNWSDQTALNYMNVYRQWGDIPTGLEITPLALRLLSGSSVPEPAREEAKALATQGETITPTKAREIIAKGKPKRTPSSSPTTTSSSGDGPKSAPLPGQTAMPFVEPAPAVIVEAEAFDFDAAWEAGAAQITLLFESFPEDCRPDFGSNLRLLANTLIDRCPEVTDLSHEPLAGPEPMEIDPASLPVRKKLPPTKDEYFEADVRFYGRIQGALLLLKRHASEVYGKQSTAWQSPFYRLVFRLMNVDSPFNWQVCSKCQGNGGSCSKCRGHGYQIPSVR